MQNMISIEDRVPEDRQVVLIYTNETNVFGSKGQLMRFHVATFVKGRTAEEVERDRCSTFGDQQWNNRVPYGWKGDGPCAWFGQEVTHWMPLPNEQITQTTEGDSNES